MPPEIWPILTVLVGALGFWWRESTKARYQGDLAAANERVMAAEGELAAKKADAEQTTALARIAERQHTLLEALRADMARRDRAIVTRWGTVSALFNDIKAQEANTYNTLRRIETGVATTNERLNQLPNLIQAATNQSVTDIGASMGAEIGAAIARQFALKNAERTLYPFPDAEDKRWRDDWIIPLVPDLILSKQPYFDDDVKLKKSCSKILAEGESVRLIEEPDIDAVAIWKEQDGVPCYGWLPRNRIKIGQPAPENPVISS